MCIRDRAKGYAAELYPDGEAGYKAFLKNKYDLCVFDVMMPKKDGFTLAQEVRAANAEIPIIFLTAKTLKEDILEGFKIGADDYITKPFSMEELTFRIEAILRRVRGKKNKESIIYKIGKFTFDTQKQTLATAEKQTKPVSYTHLDVYKRQEALLFESGIIKRRGRITAKNTVSDYFPVEQEYGYSVFSTVFHVEWNGKKLNIIDCPGSDDFVGAAMTALNVTDTAILLLNGQYGPEVGTQNHFRYT